MEAHQELTGNNTDRELSGVVVERVTVEGDTTGGLVAGAGVVGVDRVVLGACATRVYGDVTHNDACLQSRNEAREHRGLGTKLANVYNDTHDKIFSNFYYRMFSLKNFQKN